MFQKAYSNSGSLLPMELIVFSGSSPSLFCFFLFLIRLFQIFTVLSIPISCYVSLYFWQN
jgi:hypothetical protein